MENRCLLSSFISNKGTTFKRELFVGWVLTLSLNQNKVLSPRKILCCCEMSSSIIGQFCAPHLLISKYGIMCFLCALERKYEMEYGRRRAAFVIIIKQR